MIIVVVPAFHFKDDVIVRSFSQGTKPQFYSLLPDLYLGRDLKKGYIFAVLVQFCAEVISSLYKYTKCSCTVMK